MNLRALRFEHDRRILIAALRFVDAATARPIGGDMRVDAPGVSFKRKPNGDLIVTRVSGDAAQSLEVTPSDSAYLPRRFVLTLPRTPKPEDENSIFKPVAVRLYPSPNYPVSGNGAALRVTLRKSDTNERVGGALLRLSRTGDDAFEAYSMTNAAGEALIVAPDAPLTVSDGGTGRRFEISAQLSVVAKRDGVRLTLGDDVCAACAEPHFPDPDDLLDHRTALETAPVAVELKGGQIVEAGVVSWTAPAPP